MMTNKLGCNNVVMNTAIPPLLIGTFVQVVLFMKKVYFGWFGNLFSNVGRITGYAIHQDWDGNNSAVASNTTIKSAPKGK